MPSSPAAAARRLDGWLGDGAAPTADWGGYILRRALRGELGDGGPGLLLDLPALLAPYACRSDACTPGRRGPAALSCCADLEVGLSDGEREVLDTLAAPLREVMADDPRWAAEPPPLFDDGALARPGGRCVLARDTPAGLRCALHEVAARTSRPVSELKPLPCQLFPLVVIDLGDGRRLLTALHARTTRMLAAPPTRRFPCLGDGPPLYDQERASLDALFGPTVTAALDRHAGRDAPTAG